MDKFQQILNVQISKGYACVQLFDAMNRQYATAFQW